MARKKTRRTTKAKRPEESEIRKPSAPENEPKKISFWRRLVNALPLISLALLFTFVLNRAGLFGELERMFLDVQMRMSMPNDESPVVIVEIDETDFNDIFKRETTPLNVPALQRVVDAIARGEPCVVGVDLSTSFEQFRNFKTENLGNFVWARDFPAGPGPLIPFDVLGRDPELLGDDQSRPPISWGLPRTVSDKGVTRYYTRTVETNEGEMPSFSWTIFEKAKERRCPGITFPNLEASDEKLSIGFSRGVDGVGRTRIPSSHILKFDEGGWANKELIKDKIVLIGGSYLFADARQTPIGMMNGFAINANIIETELRGGGVKPPSTITVVLLQLFDGVLLMSLFQLFPWRKAAILSLPFIVVLAFACSLFTYWSFSHWAFFVPVMLGVLATELFDKLKDHFKKKYKKEISGTYAEMTGKPAEAADDEAK